MADEHLDAGGLEIRASSDWPIMLPRKLVLDVKEKRVSDGALATYAILTLLGDQADVTRATLAAALGVTKRTLQRHLKALKDHGWVDVTNGNDLILRIREAA